MSLSERDLEKYRLHKVGFVFQFFNLIPTLTAMENLELPMLIAGVDAEGAKSRSTGITRHGRPRRQRDTSGRRNCPAASSSASRWRLRWPTIRR